MNASKPSAELIDKHLDLVLKASGSALRYYTMPAVLDSMRITMSEAMQAAIAEREASQVAS